MAVAAFAAAALVLVATATLGAACLRLAGCGFLLGVYVLAWAEVVLLSEGLSLVDLVGRPGYLTGEGLALVAAAAVWAGSGRPRPLVGPRVRPAGLGRQPELVLLAAVAAAAIGYQTFLVVATPPNNYDSLTYHLTRAVAWLQQGHVGYFDAATARANAFPANGEIGILYTLALLGRDTLAALPQLLAEVAVLAAVYGIARRVGHGRRASLFAALLTATLSEVALESVTTQNDLVVASFVAAAAFFAIDGKRSSLPFAALAVGLAVGTKLTGLLALPALALVAGAFLPRRRVLQLAAQTAVALAAVGAFVYVENLAHTGHVLGVVPEADPYRSQPTVSGTVSTAARVYWRFVDFSGLDPPKSLSDGLASAGSEAFAAVRIAPNPPEATATRFAFSPETAASEDTSYFGLLGFLLVVPLSFGFLLAWLARRTGRSHGALAAVLPLFVVAVAATQSYSQWLGRFMLIPVAVTMPLAAWLFQPRFRLLVSLAVAVGGAGLLATHVHNVMKPVGLRSSKAIWELPRSQAQGWLAGSLPVAMPAIDRAVPADASLGAVLGDNDPSYLLYGPALRRHVVPLRPGDVRTAAATQGLDWIVLPAASASRPSARAWCTEELSGGWLLLARRDVGETRAACARSHRAARAETGRTLASAK